MRLQWSCKATLLKSHLDMGVLLWICCIFSEHLFLTTPQKATCEKRCSIKKGVLLLHIFRTPFPKNTLKGCFWKNCSIKKTVLKNFALFTGKHLRWTFLLIKLQAFRLLLNLSFHKNLYYNHHHVKKHKPAYCHPQSHQILSSVFLLNFNKFHKFLFSLCLWIGF